MQQTVVQPLCRLTRRVGYKWVARGRRKTAVPGLVLQARENRPPSDSADAAGCGGGSGGGFRVGFTASRKVGGAVVRNRAKRRLKAAAQDVMPGLALGGTDYVIIARAGTVDRPYDLLRLDLERALSRVAKANPSRTNQNRDKFG